MCYRLLAMRKGQLLVGLVSISVSALTFAQGLTAPAEAVGRSAYSAAVPLGQVAGSIGAGLAKGLLGPVGEDLLARSNRTTVDLMYLRPHSLKFTSKENCGQYVDLITATAQVQYATQSQRTTAIEQAIYKGYLSGCIAQQTAADKLDPALLGYYDKNRSLLKDSPVCRPFGQRADQALVSGAPSAQTKLALVNVFVSAQEAQCMR